MSRQYWKPGNMLYPVPVVMITCQRTGEKPNIITVAWTGTVCSDPAMLSISVRPERYSYDIIKETGEFVVNLVNEPLIRAADFCGVKSGRDTDKFAEMKLTPVSCRNVAVPAIAQSPVSIECKVSQIITLGTHDMFIANVDSVSVDDRYMDENGKFCLEKAKLVTYSHGLYYGLGEYLGKFGFSVRKNAKK